MNEAQATGLCQCGCGGKTSIARHDCARYGWVKGEPVRFIHGHQRRQPLPVGEQFGLLTVVEAAGLTGDGQTLVRCTCECGGEKIARLPKLKSGMTRSCGCMRGTRNPHGLGNHKLISMYRGILGRCNNPSNAAYSYYGGRGITVCDRWQGRDGFLNFLADMGERPDGRSIDRIDNDGPYAPENCRWATAKEQAANRRPRAGYRDKPPVRHPL